MDISLDTFPYAGTTTTCESLWMGVPVITLTGPCHAHNVGASLLTQLNYTCFITNTKEEYIKAAVDLANDLVRLQEVRKQLRPTMQKSYICDGKKFTNNLEIVYHKLWEKHVQEQLVDTLEIKGDILLVTDESPGSHQRKGKEKIKEERGGGERRQTNQQAPQRTTERKYGSTSGFFSCDSNPTSPSSSFATPSASYNSPPSFLPSYSPPNSYLHSPPSRHPSSHINPTTPPMPSSYLSPPQASGRDSGGASSNPIPIPQHQRSSTYPSSTSSYSRNPAGTLYPDSPSQPSSYPSTPFSSSPSAFSTPSPTGSSSYI